MIHPAVVVLDGGVAHNVSRLVVHSPVRCNKFTWVERKWHISVAGTHCVNEGLPAISQTTATCLQVPISPANLGGERLNFKITTESACSQTNDEAVGEL